MSRLWLWRRILIVLASIVIALAVLPAAHAQQTFSHGAVVALEGTPHLWIADAQGVLHWGGDTRALAGKHVNWNDRTEVSVAQLRALPVGDPWLSAGLLKDGDPIYLVKWESDWARPQLLHIQSIADVELFGIDGSNYGRFVLDKATWEARYGMSAASLQRSALPAAVTTVIATPTPIPRPTIDPRLQDALNMIEETWPGAVYGERGIVTLKKTKFAFGHIEHKGHYHIATNTITVDESMRDQPLEVLAYILVHEISHALTPWTKYGKGKKPDLDYCLDNEDLAEGMAAAWWNNRYGEAGHPNTDNSWIAHFNYVAWLQRQDRASGAIGDQRKFHAYVVEVYKDICKLEETAPTPTPAPESAPVPIPGNATTEDADFFIANYRAFARRGIADALGVSETSATVNLIERFAQWQIYAMPHVYVLYTWAVYPIGTHPNTREFAKHYMGNHRPYALVAYRWLESDPCTWSTEAQRSMMMIETERPGEMRGAVEAALSPDWMAEHAYNAAIKTAGSEYLKDPNAYLERFFCPAD